MFMKSILDKKFTPYIYILFFILAYNEITAQNINLKITTSDPSNTQVLKPISYIKSHPTKKTVYEEIDKVQNKLKKIGFFTSKIDTIYFKETTYKAVLNLGVKIEEIMIIIPKKNKIINLGLPSDSLIIKTKYFEEFTNKVLTNLDKKGKSFSEIRFLNPTYKENILLLELDVFESKKRQIDKVVIKGYEEFPRIFIKNFYNIKKQTVFSKKKLQEISQVTKLLKFAQEKKKPEVLFKKDSTHIYLFLDQVKTSSFDGILNFTSKENGQGLLLNGNLDLKLNNTLDSGEQFELFWNKVAKEKSEFRIHTKIPYVFNSSFSSEIGFELYRQDSTFLNSKFNFKTTFDMNVNSKISVSYLNEKSNYLLDIIENNLNSFSNEFVGLEYQIIKPSKTSLFEKKYNLSFHILTGRKKTNLGNENQIKGKITTSLNIKTNHRSYVYIRNVNGILKSNNYLINELYRIGGANSIRGINEQSIFTNLYSYANIEYRYLTSESSYIYSITDAAAYRHSITDNIDSILGLGIGYQFEISNNYINLGVAIGNTSNNYTKLNNSKLIVKWTSYF